MIKRETVEGTIGKGFADKLDETVMDAGKLTFTRREMVDNLGCANFIAASRLSKVLHRLDVVTPTALFKLGPFSLARCRGIGEASLFVAMCALNAHGFDVRKWWGWGGEDAVKFSAMKHRAMRRASKRKQQVQ